MKLSKNDWKRKTATILFIFIIVVVVMIPMTGLSQSAVQNDGQAVQPADVIYKLSDIDEPPRVIRAFPPKYPAIAKEEKIEGRIVVELVVTKEGTPRDEWVIDAEPPDIFEVAALEAVRKYQFAPGKKNNEAVDVRVKLPIRFALDDDSEPHFNLDPEAKAVFSKGQTLSEGNQPPRVIEASQPIYPLGAKEEKIEGKVVLKFVVATDGLAKEPEVVTATPVDIFESAALDAIELYKFEPAKMNGTPVDCIVYMPIVFELGEDNSPPNKRMP